MTAIQYRILIVDDEPEAREMFIDSFREDYQIFSAGSGETALEILKAQDIHLVFTDERMPGMTGIELLERVKNEYPDAVRILTTGVTDLQTAVDSINRGKIHRYIPKPWNEAELKIALDEQLRIRDLDQENQRLTRLTMLKEEILQTVSHEFRTPLTCIIGYLELLNAGHFGTLTKSQQEPIEVAFESSLYLKQILENILLLSKLKTESVPMAMEQFDLMELLREVTVSLVSMARKKKLELVLTEAALPYIIGDRQKLQDVFFNLIHNAIKFTRSGSVAITPVMTDGVITVSVSDSGKGIPAEQLETIFNQFQQVEGANTASLKGLGLGLSITEGLVRLHQGSIAVASEEEKGSVFTVSLPVVPQQTSSPAPVRFETKSSPQEVRSTAS